MSKWKHKGTEFVCLFGKRKKGKLGGGLKVRRDTGEQMRSGERKTGQYENKHSKKRSVYTERED